MVLIVAHRGASGYEKENTIAAFEKAIEMGVDVIETDVTLTLDKHIVAQHGLIGFPIFARLLPYALMKNTSIPHIKDILNITDKKCALMIDIKTAGVAQRILPFVKNKNVLFTTRIASEFQFLKSQGMRAGMTIDFPHRNLPFGDLDLVCIPHRFASRSLIDKAKQHNCTVFVWDVVDPQRADALTEIGVDGIFSRKPDQIMR